MYRNATLERINRDIAAQHAELRRTAFAFTAGLMFAAAIGLASVFVIYPSPNSRTFDLVEIDGAGEAYTLDYGLSVEDCAILVGVLADTGKPNTRCEVAR